jgi:hypothetical protein
LETLADRRKASSLIHFPVLAGIPEASIASGRIRLRGRAEYWHDACFVWRPRTVAVYGLFATIFSRGIAPMHSLSIAKPPQATLRLQATDILKASRRDQFDAFPHWRASDIFKNAATNHGASPSDFLAKAAVSVCMSSSAN